MDITGEIFLQVNKQADYYNQEGPIPLKPK